MLYMPFGVGRGRRFVRLCFFMHQDWREPLGKPVHVAFTLINCSLTVECAMGCFVTAFEQLRYR